jgi:hypothetical protein
MEEVIDHVEMGQYFGEENGKYDLIRALDFGQGEVYSEP